MSDLPPIRLDRSCPKCGGKDIDTRWVKEAAFAGSSAERVQRRLADQVSQGTRMAIGEHMARTCKTCQYKWAARPLDLCSAVDRLGAVGASSAG